MKNTIKKKNARRTANLMRKRILITVNFADIARHTVFVYPIVGYSANGTQVVRFTVYTDTFITMDIIATYVIENLDLDILRRLRTLKINDHIIFKEPITGKLRIEYSEVAPWVYAYNNYIPNSLKLVSW